MAVRIKLSYTDRKELIKVLELLTPHIKRWKLSCNDKGAYKKAYIELKEEESQNEARETFKQ